MLLHVPAQQYLVHEHFKLNANQPASVHIYERTKPLQFEEVQEQGGTVHIINGAGGQPEASSIHDGHPQVYPEWLVTRSLEIGYGLLSATSTELSWEFRRSSDDHVVDNFTLTRVGL